METQISKLRICMVQKKKDLPAHLARYDIAIRGHTHRDDESFLRNEQNTAGQILIMNADSYGLRRYHLPVSLTVTSEEQNGFKTEKMTFLILPVQ